LSPRIIGIECPQGYSVYHLVCDVCRHRMGWVQPECIDQEPGPCTRCQSTSLSNLEDDE